MIKYENQCVCPTELGCLGEKCPYLNVPYFYCDECDNEVEDLYMVEDKQVCEQCLLSMFEKINIDNHLEYRQ